MYSGGQQVTLHTFHHMTEEQLDALRHLIKQEIDAAQIDGMEHGAWGWADKMLEEGWQDFKNSFKTN